MKRFFISIMVACFFLGCRKAQEESKPDSSALIGSWRWVLATGGLLNIYITPQNSGQAWSLTLKSDSTYSQTGTLNGAPSSGLYSLRNEPSPVSVRNILLIHLNARVKTYDYSFRGDTLKLDNQVELDGLSYFLVRE